MSGRRGAISDRSTYHAQYINKPCNNWILLSPPDTYLRPRTLRNSSSYNECFCTVLDLEATVKMASRMKGLVEATCVTVEPAGRDTKGM